MNVLFCARDDILKDPAGDTTQILKTAEYLKSKGVQAKINYSPTDDFCEYDIIHLFNLTPIERTYECFKRAQLSRNKIVISPIYWNLERYYRFYGSTDRLYLWNRYKSFRKEILKGCEMIYTSGKRETEMIQQEIGEELPFTVIHNGVDVKTFCRNSKPPNDAEPTFRVELPYILCAARICPRKNQLMLAKVCNAMGKKLVLAGKVNNKKYLEQCLNYKNVSYAGFLEQEELSSLYENAGLHVLASFAETPGLASLEAAAMGCNVVSTSEGDASEYFEDMASYCNPYDENDISRAVAHGLSNDFQPHLKNHLLENYSWERCLEPLYQSYLNIKS